MSAGHRASSEKTTDSSPLISPAPLASNRASSSDHIVHLNVGGVRFSSSHSTLTWVPDSFFTSLLSGRISSLTDEETGAIFIDRDPDAFRVILNWLRTKQVDLSRVPLSLLKHEALFYGLGPLVKRLSLCDELEESACGNVLYAAMIPAPSAPYNSQNVKNKQQVSQSSSNSSNSVPFSPRVHGHAKKGSGEMLRFDASRPQLRVRQIRAHHNMIAVAYAEYVCVYRLRESAGWNPMFTTPRVGGASSSTSAAAEIQLVALHTKFGPQGSDRMLAVALSNGHILLWAIEDEQGTKRGSFVCDCPISKLFFVGSQLVALSRKGKVIIWHSVSQNWQVQDVMPISCYDTAGSSLILGCTNGSMYYIDMQKFPLRMKDNDLLVTELYKDPNGECITALSVYLTPKTNVCGNWIEIAYGTASGTVRLIVQHPETVGHGPQLFQTFTVHNSSILQVALTTNYLISVCSEYNHVRTWAITRFRGMISTQPGSTSLASFKVLTLDVAGENHDREYISPGPFGDQESDQVFVQLVIPESNQVFIRLASTGERVCTIKTVDGAPITAYAVHECEGSSRMGGRPRRFLFCGTLYGTVQMFDLTTALDQHYASRSSVTVAPSLTLQPSSSFTDATLKATTSAAASSIASVNGQKTLLNSGQALGGPTPQEFLALLDECELCYSVVNTPSSTPHPSTINLLALDTNSGGCNRY